MKAAALLLLLPGLLPDPILAAVEKAEAEPLRTDVYRLRIALLKTHAP